MKGRCLTTAGTWEKLQSWIMKYIARINAARYTILDPDTSRRSDISASLVNIYFAKRHFHDPRRLFLAMSLVTLCLLRAASEER